MKKDIHPVLLETPVTCTCGNTFTLQTVMKEMRIEKCSQCHPFYTGVQKFGSTDGRIDRFNRKFNRN